MADYKIKGVVMSTAYEFGRLLGQRQEVKQSESYGSAAGTLLGDMYRGGVRNFKGITGGIGSAIGTGAAGLGLAGTDLYNNTVGRVAPNARIPDSVRDGISEFGGTYADAMQGYGRDLAQGLGMGPNGLAGTINPAERNLSFGSVNSQGDIAANNQIAAMPEGQSKNVADNIMYYKNQLDRVAPGLMGLRPAKALAGLAGRGAVSGTAMAGRGALSAGRALVTNPTVQATAGLGGAMAIPEIMEGGRSVQAVNNALNPAPAPEPKADPSLLSQAGDWVKNNPGTAALGAGGLGLGAYGLYKAMQGKKKRTKASSADGRDHVLDKSGFYVSNDMMAPGRSSDMAGFITATSMAKKKKKPKAKPDNPLDILHRRVNEKGNGEAADLDISGAKSAAQFGAALKRASMLGDVANGLSTSWNNASRVFKGGTGAVAGGLGTVGAGLAGGAMQGANAVGGLFGKQPFSNETVDTAYGTADHYANMGSAYGKDLAQGLGLGPQGLAGTTMNNPSAGDEYIKQVQNMPGVTDEARRISNMGMSSADLASKAAPAAALGGGIQMAGNLVAGAPLTTGISSFSPVAAQAPQAAGVAGKALGVAKNLNSTSNPLGWGAGAGANAARQYQNYQPGLAGK